MSFETALTGLNAAAADLDVTGNNIANSATVGFKESRAEFADIFAASNLGVASNAIGQGVRLAAVTQQFSQGQFSFTGNSLDLAINGNGFFWMKDGGEDVYTRAGAFQLDRDGFIVDSSGRQLTGFRADPATGQIIDARGPIQINTGDVDPKATEKMAITANLASDSAAPATAPFDPADPDSYNFSTSSTIYDSQGGSHLLTMYFVKTGTPNEWEIHTRLDGEVPDSGSTHTVTFDDKGRLASSSGDSFTVDLATGGLTPPHPFASVADISIDVNLENLTQFGTPFGVTQLQQDGYAAGQFSSLSVEADGRITARYTNGQSQVFGQVALVNFAAPQKLQQIGDNAWVSTFASGNPIPGGPGSAGLGSVQSGALEQSNVNVSEQLVKMITAQRSYQANAKMIATQDQITQEILNIR